MEFPRIPLSELTASINPRKVSLIGSGSFAGDGGFGNGILRHGFFFVAEKAGGLLFYGKQVAL